MGSIPVRVTSPHMAQALHALVLWATKTTVWGGCVLSIPISMLWIHQVVKVTDFESVIREFKSHIHNQRGSCPPPTRCNARSHIASLTHPFCDSPDVSWGCFNIYKLRLVFHKKLRRGGLGPPPAKFYSERGI